MSTRNASMLKCDVCSHEIESSTRPNNWGWINANLIDRMLGEMSNGAVKKSLDICGQCTTELREWHESKIKRETLPT